MTLDHRAGAQVREGRDLIEIGTVFAAIRDRNFNQRARARGRRRIRRTLQCTPQLLHAADQRIEVDRNRTIGGNDVSNAGETLRCNGCGDADGARVDGGIDHGVELEQQRRVSRVTNHAARACSSLP